jgi:hypothetical protein
VTTASAYSAYDTVGSAFEVPLVIGSKDGLITQVSVYDNGTGNGNLAFHFFARPPSAQVDGTTFTIADADRWHHLGVISGSTWVTAGTARNMMQISDQHLILRNFSGNRSVWVNTVALAAVTFGATASAQALSVRTLEG